jgi:hypothetical protein
MMIHSYEPVSEREWTLKGVDDPTGAKLLEDVDPRSLVDQLAKKVGQAAVSQSKQRCVASYQEQTADKSHTRSCVFIAIDDGDLFNQLFNGRSGYRAMYYHHPDIGLAYNGLIAECIVETLRLPPDPSRIAGTAKVWPFYELTYAPGVLAVERWKGKMTSSTLSHTAHESFMKGRQIVGADNH